MENMVNSLDIFDGFFNRKRVLITGHTGFKGSWLSIWLYDLGAEVIGVAQDPYTERDNYVLSGIRRKIKADLRADIRDGKKMKEIFQKYQPEIVFHLAAQPLVRLSYEIPVETYETNVIGTINILEAIRATHSVKVGIMITTDKCYENKEHIWGYHENEPLESITKAGKMHAFKHYGFWKAMDMLKDNKELNEMWNKNKAPWKIW